MSSSVSGVGKFLGDSSMELSTMMSAQDRQISSIYQKRKEMIIQVWNNHGGEGDIREFVVLDFRTELEPELQKDADVVMAAVKFDPRWLAVVSQQFRDDESIVLAAVQSWGCALGHASDRLKNNPIIVMAAIQQSPVSIIYVGDTLKNDQDIWRAYYASKQSERKKLESSSCIVM